MATTIPEAVTTIPAGTLRLFLTSISYRAKARKRAAARAANGSAPPAVPPAAGLPRRVEGARLTRCALIADRRQIASRRADPMQVGALTPQQVRRVCIAETLSALASNLHTVGTDPAGLAWYAV